MIPYSIERISPSDDIRDSNICTIYGCIEKTKLNQMIIDFITEIMYDFCSKETGYNIQITSYEDFCIQFWKITEFQVRSWYYIFKIYYFENEWIEWNIEEHTEQIYTTYTNTFFPNSNQINEQTK